MEEGLLLECSCQDYHLVVSWLVLAKVVDSMSLQARIRTAESFGRKLAPVDVTQGYHGPVPGTCSDALAVDDFEPSSIIVR